MHIRGDIRNDSASGTTLDNPTSNDSATETALDYPTSNDSAKFAPIVAEIQRPAESNGRIVAGRRPQSM
ncbi:hypothetical protein BW12_03980 [Bifidobacterium sp. UTCIF-3]|nr:hypothetical protein BW09_02045 [Bifidobacterium sp. UTCIF-1]TPF80720.1 hypothetical protein BW08_03320 [Bifidobacterium sp. UTCIF-24]TPF82624.1 hypothetical protein BW12_03980 [Bifidobacterium sp. UTCIF-3]TPF84765.1 hypothetical protein BW07_03250 [Bifidobacterium sp. UTCIF-36]TPF90102.1 hypothetical protein BW10_03855 [Bifidobacterium sp. UTBIF-56]TPF94775.1 hypothetical protein BW14_00890 [Bifidobacterium sp. UTBIF-68]